MTFCISALVSARDSHIKPDSEAGGLIPVTMMKNSCHNLFITYLALKFFQALTFIFELTNCENKSLREMHLLNLQIFLFRVWFQKDIKQCRSVQ